MGENNTLRAVGYKLGQILETTTRLLNQYIFRKSLILGHPMKYFFLSLRHKPLI